jgi:hypothetical protein
MNTDPRYSILDQVRKERDTNPNAALSSQTLDTLGDYETQAWDELSAILDKKVKKRLYERNRAHWLAEDLERAYYDNANLYGTPKKTASSASETLKRLKKNVKTASLGNLIRGLGKFTYNTGKIVGTPAAILGTPYVA